MVAARTDKASSPTIAEHERAFRPSNPGKKGVNGTLTKFPDHKASPCKDKKYIKPEEDAEQGPPGFKATYKYRSRPTPSVATNFRNLKASYPMAFKK